MRPSILIFFSVLFSIAGEIPVYFSSAEEGIYRASLETDAGELSEPELVAKVSRSTFLVSRDEFLYSTSAAFKKDGGVVAFKIEPDGALTKLNEKPSGGSGSCHASLDKTGKVLLVANYSGGSCASYAIKPDGSIGEEISLHQHEGSSVNEQRQKSPHPHSIYVSPDNRFVYVPDLGTDEIWIYALDAESATLTLKGKARHPAGGGPRHMKFGKDGKYAYVLSELTLETIIYERDAGSGLLTMKGKVSNFPPDVDKEEMTCSEIRVSGDGKYLYAANRDLAGKGRDALSVFYVKKSGDIELIQVLPSEAWIPRNINISPDGKWLLVAGQKSNEVTVFEINSDTGKLTFTGHRVRLKSAMCVEFPEASQ